MTVVLRQRLRTVGSQRQAEQQREGWNDQHTDGQGSGKGHTTLVSLAIAGRERKASLRRPGQCPLALPRTPYYSARTSLVATSVTPGKGALSCRPRRFVWPSSASVSAPSSSPFT